MAVAGRSSQQLRRTPTVITTCPRLARQFADEHGNVVVKSASGPPPGDPALEYVTLAGLAYAAFDFAEDEEGV